LYPYAENVVEARRNFDLLDFTLSWDFTAIFFEVRTFVNIHIYSL